jgi:hypothetical protein
VRPPRPSVEAASGRGQVESRAKSFALETLAPRRPPKRDAPAAPTAADTITRVSFEVSRLRAGEVASGLGGILLLSWTGRRRFPVIRWLSLTTGVFALALPYTQATRRAPALPVALSVVVSALSAATVLGLLGRTLVGRPRTRRGAYFGLLAAMTTAAGGYASMRQESGADPAELGELQTITLAP